MAIRDTNSLKMAFETGKIPQQQDFHDLIDSAVVASSGITPLAPADTMAAPNGSKRYVATAAGTYSNLKLADGSAAPAISVSGEELAANIVYLIYTASSNSWSKLLQNSSGPAGPQGPAGPMYHVDVTTGTAVEFTGEKDYGTIASPVSGNITHTLTGAEVGVCITIIHQAASEPTYPATWKKLSGGYNPGGINYIVARYFDSSNVRYIIQNEPS